ncbi:MULTISPECIES: hypothetical protein [unclassified Streptosporangium]|uniref:hypothetical protein n=1 Tax=Streptosporangium sp. NPDC006013 TaxID=3155596 RepID=UPI0033B8F5BA
MPRADSSVAAERPNSHEQAGTPAHVTVRQCSQLVTSGGTGPAAGSPRRERALIATPPRRLLRLLAR